MSLVSMARYIIDHKCGSCYLSFRDLNLPDSKYMGHILPIIYGKQHCSFNVYHIRWSQDEIEYTLEHYATGISSTMVTKYDIHHGDDGILHPILWAIIYELHKLQSSKLSNLNARMLHCICHPNDEIAWYGLPDKMKGILNAVIGKLPTSYADDYPEVDYIKDAIGFELLNFSYDGQSALFRMKVKDEDVCD